MQEAEVARERLRDRETRPGWWVAAARLEAAKRKGLTRPISQMKLAVKAGLDRNTITRWEMEDGEVAYVTWVGLLGLLELPIDWEPSSPKKAKAR